MSFSRRHLVAISAASALDAACSGVVRKPSAPQRLDAGELDRQARALSARARPGLLDIGVMDLGAGRVWFMDPTGHYPLAGLSKLPAAAAALALTDAGRLRLNERVRLTVADASPPPSRVNGLFAAEREREAVDMPLADLIALSVQQDDATAGDAVLRLAGGPRSVTQWLESRGVQGVRIDRYDREWLPQVFGLGEFKPAWRQPAAFADAMEAVAPGERQSAMDAWLADPRDTATMPGLIAFLDKLDTGALVGAESTRFLERLMQARAGGGAGLAEGLPRGSVAASAAATTPTSLGFTPADNAVAIVRLADGRRLAMAVFIAGATDTAAARRRLMADAARLVAEPPA